MKRHVIATVLIGIVMFFSLRQWQATSNVDSKKREVPRERVQVSDSSNVSPGFGNAIRTKVRIRNPHPRPTIEETKNLIRTTIIPLLDLPSDQPLPERIARINELIQKTGVEPYRLRLLLRSADPAGQWKMKSEMRIREIPLSYALKYLCDTTKLNYQVKDNGIVELTTSRDQETMPDLPDPVEKLARTPSGEIDIFGNDTHAPEEQDPFADPVHPQ